MKTGYLSVGLALALGAANAGYVLEWSASGLAYSYAYVYTANPAVRYDVTGDSIPEIFIADSSSLKVYSGVTHSLIWTIPSGGYTTIGFPHIANTDGDVQKELVVLCYSYSSGYTGKFYIYDCQSRDLEYTSPTRNGYLSLAVADVDGDGKSEICLASGTTSRILEVYGSTDAGCDEAGEHPALHERAAAPNPATGLVRLQLPEARSGDAVEIADLAGRVIRAIAAAGPEVVWNCADDQGRPVPPGVYLWRCGGASGSVTVVR